MSRVHSISNLFGNIVLFIPISFVFITIFRVNKFLQVLLTGFLISLTIESIQFIFEVGVTDIDDIIVNTLGTALGFLCF